MYEDLSLNEAHMVHNSSPIPLFCVSDCRSPNGRPTVIKQRLATFGFPGWHEATPRAGVHGGCAT